MHRHLFARVLFIGLALSTTQLWAQQADREEGRDSGKNAKTDNRQRPHLGITIAPSNTTETEGVLVQQIASDSPAARAGIKKGDVITRADGRNITDADDLVNILAHHQPGDKLRVHVMRNDQDRTLTITLGERVAARTEEGAEEGSGTAQAQRQMPFLGVHAMTMEELPRRLRERMGIEGEQGLVVMDVVPNSPAAKAGLHHGDVILSLNNKEMASEHDLRNQIRSAKIGSTIKMEIQRGEQKKEVTAKLTEAPWQFSMGQDHEPRGRISRFFGNWAGYADGEERQIERLERHIQRLERRIQELEERLGQKTRERSNGPQ